MRIVGDVVKTMKTYLHFDERIMVEIGHQSAQKLKACELQKARFDMIENLHAQGFVGVSGETFDGKVRKLVTQNLYVVHPSHIRYLQEAEETIDNQKKRIAELESALCETCGEPRCEDSVVEHLKQKVARLEKALSHAYFGIRELKSQFEFCDCSDDPQDDICLHCILGNIMRDIEKQKGMEDT
jgi:hypothetical protein